MPREFPRSRRIEEQIQRILGEVIRAEARDPRLEKALVTAVEVTRDISIANVYVSTFAESVGHDDLLDACRSASGFLRRRLAEELNVRNVPELRFAIDDSLARGDAMDSLIDAAVSRDRVTPRDEDDGAA